MGHDHLKILRLIDREPRAMQTAGVVEALGQAHHTTSLL